MKWRFFLVCFLGSLGLLYAEEPLVLKFWELCLQEEVLQPLLAEFEKQHPGIRVELERLTWSNGLDKILIASSTGTGPDICELGSTWVAQFINANRLVDLTEEFTETQQNYLMWEPLYGDSNRVFGAPWLIGTRILFYRKDWLTTHSFPHPARTLEELKQQIKQLHQPEKKVWGYGLPVGEIETTWKGFLPFLWTLHGPILKGEKESTLVASTALEAFNYYQELSQWSLVDKAKNLDQAFVQGKLAYHLSGPWLFKRIEKENPNLAYGLSIFPGKERSSLGTSFLGGEVLVLFRQKEKKREQAAKQLLHFLLQRKHLLEVCQSQSSLFPALKNLEETAYIQEDTKHQILYQQIQNARHPPCLPEWNALSKDLNLHLERLVQNKETPAESLKQFHAKLQKQLKEPKPAISEVSKIPFFLGILGILIVFFKRGKGKEQGFLPWFWLAPCFLLFGFFQVYPIFYTIYLSCTHTEFLSEKSVFVGLFNYRQLVQDPFFRQCFQQTLFFAIGTVPFNIGLGLLAAAFMEQTLRFKTFFRVTFFVPNVTGLIVTALIFSAIYEPNGMLNHLIRFFHLGTGKNWLMEKEYALLAIMLMAVWSSFGYYAILFLGGMKTISPALYEAAKLDGASSWNCFWHITLPQLRPFILFAVLLNTIRSLQVFPEIFTMTQGGPEGSTATAVYYIYQVGFQEYQIGKACAASLLLVGMILGIALLQKACFRER